MRKEPNPLWSTPHNFIAFRDFTLTEVIGHGKDEDLAYAEGVIAGEHCPYVLSRRQLWRPVIELKDIRPKLLVLLVNDNREWKKGKLFWIKSIIKTADILQKDKVEKVLIKGLYLDDLLDMPWFMLTDAYLFSTTIKEYYHGDKKGYFVYEPVISEVDQYMPSIHKCMKASTIALHVPNYQEKNSEINKMFAMLKGQIRENKKEHQLI